MYSNLYQPTVITPEFSQYTYTDYAAPNPHPCYHDTIFVDINAEEYECAEWMAGHKTFPGQTSKRRQGFVDRPFFWGGLGEIAFAKVFNQPVQLEDRPEGIDVDFTLTVNAQNLYIDVKTSSKPKQGFCYIQAINEAGRPIHEHTKVNAYVAAAVTQVGDKQKTAKVALLGWRSKQWVRQTTLYRGNSGPNHKVWHLEWSDLKSLKPLWRYSVA